jgi:hypothetical protein
MGKPNQRPERQELRQLKIQRKEASRRLRGQQAAEGNHGYPARTVDGVQSGVEAPAMIAWLRYWIYNDQDAKQYFFGDDCVMYKSPWTNTQRKNWP